MGLFDRKPEKKKTSSMTDAQKNRQKHAIWDYYKKKNENLTSKPPKKKKYFYLKYQLYPIYAVQFRIIKLQKVP